MRRNRTSFGYMMSARQEGFDLMVARSDEPILKRERWGWTRTDGIEVECTALIRERPPLRVMVQLSDKTDSHNMEPARKEMVTLLRRQMSARVAKDISGTNLTAAVSYYHKTSQLRSRGTTYIDFVNADDLVKFRKLWSCP